MRNRAGSRSACRPTSWWFRRSATLRRRRIQSCGRCWIIGERSSTTSACRKRLRRAAAASRRSTPPRRAAGAPSEHRATNHGSFVYGSLMQRIVIIAVIIAAALVGVAFYSGMFSRNNAPQAAAVQDPTAQGRAGAAGRQGGPPGGRGGRGQLTVELAPVVHADVNRELSVVGNLIGDQTVSVVPKTAGRLQEIAVKL